MERIAAKYYIKTPYALEKAVQVLAGAAFETYCRTQTTGLSYMPGGGIMAYHARAIEEMIALQQSREAVVYGLSMDETAKQYREFGNLVLKISSK